MRRSPTSIVVVILALAAFFAAVAALGLWVGRIAGERNSGPTIPAAQALPPVAPAPAAAQQRTFAGVLPYRPAALPSTIAPFRLMDHERGTVSESTLRGHYSLVFFGYTHCVQICGATLGNLSFVMDELGTAADDFTAYFITVDPQRDTRAVMEAYVRGANEHVRGVTGTEEQVEAALAAFGAERVVHPAAGDGAGYLVDHTGVVFFLDRQGRYKLHFREGTPAYEMATTIRANW